MSEELSCYPSDYRVFLLYTGYVESNAVSPLIMTHNFRGDEKEDTWQEAWEVAFNSLRTAIWEASRLHAGLAPANPDNNYMRDIRRCCDKVVDNEETKYCPKCGISLEKYRVTDLDNEERFELVSSYIHFLVANDLNGMNYEISLELLGSYHWSVSVGIHGIRGKTRPEFITSINENSAAMIANPEYSKQSFFWNDKKNFWGNVSIHKVFADLLDKGI